MKDTFFSRLNLQKNPTVDNKEISHETVSNTEINESDVNDSIKCVTDKNNETLKPNYEMVDQECTTPKIIRKFTTCLDIEQKLKDRYSNFDQLCASLQYKDDSYDENYDEEYYDGNYIGGNDNEDIDEGDDDERSYDDVYIVKTFLTSKVIAEAKNCYTAVSSFW